MFTSYCIIVYHARFRIVVRIYSSRKEIAQNYCHVAEYLLYRIMGSVKNFRALFLLCFTVGIF